MSQKKLIKAHLERGDSITQKEALDWFGCFRLAPRICELKEDGLNIEKEKIKTSGGARIARYSLVMQPQFTLTN
jgi:hypothetical protein